MPEFFSGCKFFFRAEKKISIPVQDAAHGSEHGAFATGRATYGGNTDNDAIRKSGKGLAQKLEGLIRLRSLFPRDWSAFTTSQASDADAPYCMAGALTDNPVTGKS